VSRHWYLLITLSAPVLVVTVTSFVLCDIFVAYRQRAQAEWLLRRARDYFSENSLRQRPDVDEMMALHDMIACHEISANYRKTARRKNNSPALSNQKTLT
jgi:hypothetical protein